MPTTLRANHVHKPLSAAEIEEHFGSTGPGLLRTINAMGQKQLQVGTYLVQLRPGKHISTVPCMPRRLLKDYLSKLTCCSARRRLLTKCLRSRFSAWFTGQHSATTTPGFGANCSRVSPCLIINFNMGLVALFRAVARNLGGMLESPFFNRFTV